MSPLGIDAIRITPWFDSPPRDAGHDVADCRAVHLRYGSTEEARELVEECHPAGILGILHIVANLLRPPVLPGGPALVPRIGRDR
ncbi:alpha-amylase family glycosyl hydrolase [Plantactinospora sp. KLBMP9567]|uniref:alpha-amylase family glycosyl hydrolase n=1 Tax=Plantactinospora sp. KLBMP9567 TaxID=3085900 RepID=UPI003990D510